MRFQCLITRSFLRRYVYGDLGQKLHGIVLAHIDRCHECRGRVQILQRARNGMMSLTAPAVTEREWETVWSGVEQQLREDHGPLPSPARVHSFAHSWSYRRYVLIAAAVAVLVAGAAVRLALSGSQSQQTSIASYIQYHEEAVDGHVLLENHFWNAQVLPVSYASGN